MFTSIKPEAHMGFIKGLHYATLVGAPPPQPSDEPGFRAGWLYGMAGTAQPQRRRPGRPKKHLEARSFVRNLLTAVASAGGELRYDKNQEFGTLRDALDLLAPFLPPRLISGLSANALADILAEWRAEITGWKLPISEKGKA
jgi:hypothetical protein